MQMSGNTILVTGGNSGIGRRIAEEFFKRGNQVLVAGRDEKKLKDVTERNPGMEALQSDTSDAQAVKKLAEDAVARFPALNAVFHFAGVMIPEDLLHGKNLDTIDDRTVATNLLGPIRLTEALLPHFQKQPRATIMTVTSGLAFAPMAMTPTYCATKAAIHSYTQSLRYQLKDTKIQVIELAPPYVQTELMGPQMATDPNAMPLEEFVSEAMDLLATKPEADEILVKRVHAQRFAAEKGQEAYNAFFKQFNDRMSASRAH